MYLCQQKGVYLMFQSGYGSGTSMLANDDTLDSELVMRAQQADRAAFTTLFERYNAGICTYLTRMVGNNEDGRELAQETFLKAWRGLPGLREASQFKPWLYRIATNLAYDYGRRQQKIRMLPWVNAKTSMLDSITDPEELITVREQTYQALAQVQPKFRTCMLLYHVAGFSQREISGLLGINEKSVSTYISYGRQQFRKAYQRIEKNIR